MTGNSFHEFAGCVRQSESFNGSKENINSHLMGQIARLLIIKAYNSTDMSNLENRKSPGAIVKIAQEFKSVRNGKVSVGSKASSKNNLSSSYKPRYVDGSVFAQTRGSISNGKTRLQQRRKSLPATTSVSLQIRDLKKNNLVCEKNLIYPLMTDDDVGENKNFEGNSLPFLTKQINNWTVKPEQSRIRTARERHRSLSGQATIAKIGEISKQDQRSLSVDSSSAKALLQQESRSSSLVSGKYSLSLANSKSGTKSPAGESQFNANSARSAYSTSRRKLSSQKSSVHPLSTLEMINGMNVSNSELFKTPRTIPIKLKSKRDCRSVSVYSPSSAASTEVLSRYKQKDISCRRASLPNSHAAFHSLVAQTIQSPEFFKTLNELNGEKSMLNQTKKNDLNQVNTSNLSSPVSSAKEPQRCDVLQKIEEVLLEAPQDTDQHCDTKLTNPVSDQMNMNSNELIGEQEIKEPISEPSLPISNTNGNSEQNVKALPDLLLQARSKKPSGSFSPNINQKVPQKITSKLESTESISDKEISHTVAQQDNFETNKIKFSTLLCTESDSDSDFIDDSVILKDDDDLCDDDFHEKRIILWLKGIKTGEEATQRIRDSPPPSPDLSAQESAIRVVYKGDT